MLGEGELVFQAPAGTGPAIADGERADHVIGGSGLLVVEGGSRDRDATNPELVIPTTAETQIPAIAGQGGRTESSGDDRRHGKQSKFHF